MNFNSQSYVMFVKYVMLNFSSNMELAGVPILQNFRYKSFIKLQ